MELFLIKIIMYNVYAYDKKAKAEKQQQTIERTIKESEQNRDILTARYKDRINNTLLKLNKDAENLPRPQRAQTAVHTQRSWLKSSGFISEHDRVRESAD